jgi:hypothetical protein
MSDPLFMSDEHVQLMNSRLAASPEVASAAGTMDRSYELAYELHDPKAERTEYWLMHLGPDGVWFALEPSESADLTFVGDYRRMVEASRKARSGEQSDPGVEPIGDLTVLQTVAEVFAVAQQVGTVPVTWPE